MRGHKYSVLVPPQHFWEHPLGSFGIRPGICSQESALYSMGDRKLIHWSGEAVRGCRVFNTNLGIVTTTS